MIMYENFTDWGGVGIYDSRIAGLTHSLEAGTHTIRIQKSAVSFGYAELDKLEVISGYVGKIPSLNEGFIRIEDKDFTGLSGFEQSSENYLASNGSYFVGIQEENDGVSFKVDTTKKQNYQFNMPILMLRCEVYLKISNNKLIGKLL